MPIITNDNVHKIITLVEELPEVSQCRAHPPIRPKILETYGQNCMSFVAVFLSENDAKIHRVVSIITEDVYNNESFHNAIVSNFSERINKYELDLPHSQIFCLSLENSNEGIIIKFTPIDPEI
jgi:hypothetical protein